MSNLVRFLVNFRFEGIIHLFSLSEFVSKLFLSLGSELTLHDELFFRTDSRISFSHTSNLWSKGCIVKLRKNFKMSHLFKLFLFLSFLLNSILIKPLSRVGENFSLKVLQVLVKHRISVMVNFSCFKNPLFLIGPVSGVNAIDGL